MPPPSNWTVYVVDYSQQEAHTPASPVTRLQNHKPIATGRSYLNHSSNRLLGTYVSSICRVHCDLSQTSTFFDVPNYSCSEGVNEECVFLDMDQPSNSSRSFHLWGERQLHNLEAYLTQNVQLEFIVFHDYRCRHDRDDIDLAGKAFGQSIYLASEALCTELRTLSISFSTPCPFFRRKTELQFPYYWHYHLRTHDVHQKSASAHAFLDFIEQSMAAEYLKVDDQRERKVVSWEYMPYLFVSGNGIYVTRVAL